jgi:2-polyprenyl-3-methyl-5-hydroxy-6-metoxy-1,4-benzoquinol methylase
LSSTAIPNPEPKTPRTPNLAHRVDPALLPEQMDGPCTYEQFLGCIRDIGFINRWTFAYGPTLRFLEQVIAKHPHTTPLRILDVGSGGGDVLRRIARWAHRRQIRVQLTGMDLNPHATRTAQELSANDPRAQNIQWLTGDVFTHPAAQHCDVVLSSLVTHHMRDPEIVEFLRWQESTARLGWFINDLVRSQKAYRFFSLASRLLRLHPFVQYDGLVSIRRALREPDWQRLLTQANLPAQNVRLARSAPGRLCLARQH